jgi:hypothetical protein
MRVALMHIRIYAAVFFLTCFSASEAQPLPPSPNNYADGATWLCRPGRNDACSAADLTATVISAKGMLSREAFKPNPKAKIDCFYVYPTISQDPGGNSSMNLAPEDFVVVKQQFARLASVCRLFAPKYRQDTLAALLTRTSGKPDSGDPELAYRDVLDAWNYYLTNDNHGRGIVLVGHSQGSQMLRRLIQEEIDGKPQQRFLVSAVLMGVNLAVPPGADVGGDFRSVRLCHTAAQTGCVVAFASFRAESPPPANALFGKINRPDVFGRAPTQGMAAACVNPARPQGGSAELKSYFSSNGVSIVTPLASVDWVTPPVAIETPFVRLPGLLQSQCVTDSTGSYLAISVMPQPGGKRTHTISGEVITDGKVVPEWGLHLVDANLVMGNLLELITSESKTYLAAPSPHRSTH